MARLWNLEIRAASSTRTVPAHGDHESMLVSDAVSGRLFKYVSTASMVRNRIGILMTVTNNAQE
jgi:hypothetical protein